jgi:hypothetical protein
MLLYSVKMRFVAFQSVSNGVLFGVSNPSVASENPGTQVTKKLPDWIQNPLVTGNF